MRTAVVQHRRRINAVIVRTAHVIVVTCTMIMTIGTRIVTVARMRVHAHRAIVIARIADRRMRAVIAVKVITRMPRIVVRITRTVVRVVVVRTDARVVIITRRCPVMAMRPLNVAPTIPHIERMLAHIIVGVEVDVRHIVARITDEHIATIADNKEVIRIRRVAVRVRSGYRTPVRISVNIKHGVRPVVGHRRNRRGAAGMINVGRMPEAPRKCKNGNRECGK